jgi:hypothetical protein
MRRGIEPSSYHNEKAGVRSQEAESRKQKAEGRRQKAEGRRQKAEGRRRSLAGRAFRPTTVPSIFDFWPFDFVFRGALARPFCNGGL